VSLACAISPLLWSPGHRKRLASEQANSRLGVRVQFLRLIEQRDRLLGSLQLDKGSGPRQQVVAGRRHLFQ